MFPIYVDSDCNEKKPLPAPIDKCVLRKKLSIIHYHWDGVTNSVSTSHHQISQHVENMENDCIL